MIQKVQFSPPKEGAKDAAGNDEKGLYQVFWTDASRPSEFRCTQTFKTYAGVDTLEALMKAAGTQDLTDAKVSVAVAEFKVDRSGGFYLRGAMYPGHLTGDEVTRHKAGTVPAPAKPLPERPAKDSGKAA